MYDFNRENFIKIIEIDEFFNHYIHHYIIEMEYFSHVSHPVGLSHPVGFSHPRGFNYTGGFNHP
jgi:hypothetical protein